MAIFQGTRAREVKPLAAEAGARTMDAIVDSVVVALIVAGFVSLGFNVIARL